MSPDKSKDMSYEEMVTILTNRFNPFSLEPVQHFKFDCWFRRSTWSFTEFVSELR